MLLSYDHTAELKLNRSLYLNNCSRYTALTALSIKQKVEHIMANVFLFNVCKLFYSYYVFYVF